MLELLQVPLTLVIYGMLLVFGIPVLTVLVGYPFVKLFQFLAGWRAFLRQAFTQGEN